jgi:hypothetical protein
MVWHAFVADEDIWITHADGDVGNCAVSNLQPYAGGKGRRPVSLASCPALDVRQTRQCVALYKRGESMDAIGRRFGVSGPTVHSAFVRYGVDRSEQKVQAERAHSEQVASTAVALYKSGLSWGDVCERVGVVRHTLSKHLRAAGHCSKRLARERKDAFGVNEAVATELGLTIKQVQSKAASLSKNYGITVAEYLAIKRAQSNKCAACSEPLGPERTQENAERVGSTFPVVDHCHRLGKGRHAVRGILHSECNSTLGKGRDDPEWFMRLARYARRTKYDKPLSPAPRNAELPGLH